MTDIQPSYYAIIPATVRYDSNLKANEKLLYGEITALASKNGYCWAENRYFAGLYGVHRKTISSWITNLEKRGYIKVELEYIKGTKQVSKRYIYINDTPVHQKMDRYTPKDSEGVHQKVTTPVHQKTEEELNNTSTNNTSTNSAPPSSVDDDFEKLWQLYPNKKGKKVALTAYKRAIKKGTTNKEIQDGILEYKKQLAKNNWLKPAHGSTWFNQERWEDEHEEEVKPVEANGSLDTSWRDGMDELLGRK